MNRVDSRTYVGQPNEVVKLSTQVGGGGQVSVLVNGQNIGSGRQFSLPSGLGSRVKVQVGLLGPLGATCVVGIATVDGGSDGDFLMCQAHNPAPVNFYTCSVAAAPTLNSLVQAKGLPLSASPKPSPRAAAAPKKAKRTRKAKGSGKKGGRR